MSIKFTRYTPSADLPPPPATQILATPSSPIAIPDNSADEAVISVLTLNGAATGTWSIQGGSWAKVELVGDTSSATVDLALTETLTSGDIGSETVTILHGALTALVLNIEIQAAASTALGAILVVNASASEVTEPITFGLSMKGGDFDDATQRLTTGYEYGALREDLNGENRFASVCGFVTVPALSSIEVTLSAITGSATTPATKSVADLLTLASTWDVGLSFTDETDTEWTASARTAMSGSTTWSATGDYVSASPWIDTSVRKVYICCSPFRDGATVHPTMAAMFAVHFISDDGFTSDIRVKTEVFPHNAYHTATTGDRRGYAGSLTITRGTTPATVHEWLTRSIGATSVSVSGSNVTVTKTGGDFTDDDLGCVFDSGDGWSFVIDIVLSATQIGGRGYNLPGTPPTSTTNSVVYGMRFPHTTPATMPDVWWPTTPTLQVRHRVQDIRNAYMLTNNPINTPYPSHPYTDNPAYYYATAVGGAPRVGSYVFGSAISEMRDYFGHRELNDVDTQGFITAERLQTLMRVESAMFLNAVPRYCLVNKANGLPINSTALGARMRDYSYTTNYNTPLGMETAHAFPLFYAPYLLTGDYKWLWRLQHLANGQACDLDEDGLTLSQFEVRSSGSGGQFRAHAGAIWPIGHAAALTPKTIPAGCLLLPSNVFEDSLNQHTYEDYLTDVGAPDGTKTVADMPQWTALSPFVPKYNASSPKWLYKQWQEAYFVYVLIEQYERGVLSETSKTMMRVAASHEFGRLHPTTLAGKGASLEAARARMYGHYQLKVDGTGVDINYFESGAETAVSMWGEIYDNSDTAVEYTSYGDGTAGIYCWFDYEGLAGTYAELVDDYAAIRSWFMTAINAQGRMTVTAGEPDFSGNGTGWGSYAINFAIKQR